MSTPNPHPCVCICACAYMHILHCVESLHRSRKAQVNIWTQDSGVLLFLPSPIYLNRTSCFYIILSITNNVSLRRDIISCLLSHHVWQEAKFLYTNQSFFLNNYNLPGLVLGISCRYKRRIRHDLYLTVHLRRKCIKLHRILQDGSWVERYVRQLKCIVRKQSKE